MGSTSWRWSGIAPLAFAALCSCSAGSESGSSSGLGSASASGSLASDRSPQVGLSGVQVEATVPGQTDVTAIRLNVREVTCAGGADEGEAFTGVVSVHDATDTSEDSSAVKVVSLQPGCYDLTTTPLASDGAHSTECSDAHEQLVRVDRDHTTELWIDHDCKGKPPRRGLDWAEFHHDPALSGFTRSTAPASSDLLWKVDLGAKVGGAGSPVVRGNGVYIGTQSGDVFALDKLTGATRWVHNVGFSIVAAPAVDPRGRVLVHDVGGVITALDAPTGAVLWTHPLPPGAGEWSSPALGQRNLFVGADYGDIWSLRLATGAESWVRAVSDTPPGPISAGHGMVFAGLEAPSASSVLPTFAAVPGDGSGPGWSYFYFVKHGTAASMRFSNGGAIADVDGDGRPEVCLGVIPMTNPTGNDALVCLDAATGAERFSVNLHGASRTTPAVHKGRIFVGSDDGNLYAIDGKTHAVEWTFAGGQTCSSAAVSGNGEVCYGTLNHTVYCLDAWTGALVWSFPTGETTCSGLPSCLIPALADGILFVADGSKLFAFGSKR